MQKTHPIIAQLVALDTLKTWSLIVTLFGDLDGDALSGAQIRGVLGYFGIKPEAIRVALHRLKSDGWITSTKQGREAIYRMTPMAQAETASVVPNIYRGTNKGQDGWEFHLFEDAPASSKAILLTKNLALVPAKTATDRETLVLIGKDQSIPSWIEERLLAKNLVSLAAELSQITSRFAELHDDADKQAFRLLVLHHWRRIALRDGAWAHANFFPNGSIAKCHRNVSDVLEKTRVCTQLKVLILLKEL